MDLGHPRGNCEEREKLQIPHNHHLLPPPFPWPNVDFFLNVGDNLIICVCHWQFSVINHNDPWLLARADRARLEFPRKHQWASKSSELTKTAKMLLQGKVREEDQSGPSLGVSRVYHELSPAPVSLCPSALSHFLQGNVCGCLQPGAPLLWELSTARCAGKSPNLLPAKLRAYLQTKKAVLGSYLFFFFFLPLLF